MYRLMRFYNRNRRKILIFILIIAFLFLILRVVNEFEKNKSNNIYTNNTTETEKLSNSVNSNKSLITGEKLDSKKISKNTEIIDKFLKLCKKHDIDNSYQLISNSCKEQLFNTKESFKENYIDIMFDKKDGLYTIENWYNDTYKINITENILSTGKENNYSKQDYITIVEEDGIIKLNINSFVGKTELKGEKELRSINIKIKNKLQYMNYTIFEIEVTNNNEESILLDSLENINDTYIQDYNKTKYYLYTHEISKDDLLIPQRSTKKLTLKFYSKNILSKTIDILVFKNVILNYGIAGYEQKYEYSIDL